MRCFVGRQTDVSGCLVFIYRMGICQSVLWHGQSIFLRARCSSDSSGGKWFLPISQAIKYKKQKIKTIVTLTRVQASYMVEQFHKGVTLNTFAHYFPQLINKQIFWFQFYVVKTLPIRTSADAPAFQAACSNLFCSQDINQLSLNIHSQRCREDPRPKANMPLDRRQWHFIACFGKATAKNVRRDEGKEGKNLKKIPRLLYQLTLKDMHIPFNISLYPDYVALVISCLQINLWSFLQF